MKNKTIITLLFLFGSFTAWSQQSIQVDTVEIIPENPSVADSVKVSVKVTTSDYGKKIYDSLSISGDTINIYYCISLSVAPATKTFTDTFELGTLTTGNYSVKVKAYKSSDTNNCIPYDSTNAAKLFEVTSTNSIADKILENGFSIHLAPNPSGGNQQLVIKAEKPMNLKVQLCDISGQTVRNIFSGRVPTGKQSFTTDLTDLKTGTYIYKVTTEYKIYSFKSIKE